MNEGSRGGEQILVQQIENILKRESSLLDEKKKQPECR